MNLAWLFILGGLWGSSYLFIKVAVAEVPPLTLVAGRLVLAAAILWVVLLAARQAMPRSRRLWAAFAVMGLLNGAVPYSLIFWSEQYISSGLASLLQATMPLFTVLMGHFLLRDERLTAGRVAGVVLGFVGVGLLMLPDLRQGAHANLLGQLAMVASSVSYAGAALFARSRLRGQPALVSTTGQLTMGAIWIVPLSLLVGGLQLKGLPSLPALASWLGLTILGTVIAYVIYFRLIERTSAAFTSTVTYIIPVFGLILGALVLNEPLSLTLLVSLGLILAGVLLVRR
jgi:drug/metabolite transporter (DMT)-like permease